MTDLTSFLSDAGYSESILEKGLAGLMQDWEKTVKELEKGWTLEWEDFANEVDGRRIIDEIVKAFPAATPPNLLQFDLRFRAATVMDGCIWGAEVAQDEGWNSMQHWYYFRIPKAGFPSKAQ